MTRTFKNVPFSLAVGLALLTTVFVPLAAAVPLAPSGCTASDNTSRSCVFACMAGGTVSVTGSNANEWFDQVFTASCSGGHASCEASPGESCSESAKSSSAGEGLCTMESDGEGTVSCSAQGGDPEPGCLEDPIDCLCPDWVCNDEPPGEGDLPTVPSCSVLGDPAQIMIDPGIHQSQIVAPDPFGPCSS